MENNRGKGLQVLRDFMSESMSDSMSNSAVLSFLSGIDQVRGATKWHRNQVDTKLKTLCPEYEPPDLEDSSMNVVMNNVITDENSLKSLLAGTVGNTPIGSESTNPVETSAVQKPSLTKYDHPIIKFIAIGLLLSGGLGSGMLLQEWLNPNPKFATIPAGTEFEMESEIIEELLVEGMSTSSS